MSELNELQLVEKDLLKQYINFCEEHNLRYFLMCGTLLGAIRHKGFIPWDDDIDVAMPREDYDRFCELASKHFTGDIFFQSFKTDKRYPYCFSKLRNSNTTFVERVYRYVKMNHGVYIDIFPIDGISKKSRPSHKRLSLKIFFMWMPFFLSWPGFFFRKPRLKWFLLDILVDILVAPFLLFHINNWTKKIYEKRMKKIKVEEATYVANIQCGNPLMSQIYPAYLLDEYIDWPFEDLICKVPKAYDEMLTLTYGNYMTPPPVQKQKGHHYSKGFDMHIGYKDYMKNRHVHN